MLTCLAHLQCVQNRACPSMPCTRNDFCCMPEFLIDTYLCFEIFTQHETFSPHPPPSSSFDVVYRRGWWLALFLCVLPASLGPWLVPRNWFYICRCSSSFSPPIYLPAPAFARLFHRPSPRSTPPPPPLQPTHPPSYWTPVGPCPGARWIRSCVDICRSVEFVFGPGRSFTQNAETAAEGEWGRVNDREDLSSSHGLMIQAAWYAGTFFASCCCWGTQAL